MPGVNWDWESRARSKCVKSLASTMHFAIAANPRGTVGMVEKTYLKESIRLGNPFDDINRAQVAAGHQMMMMPNGLRPPYHQHFRHGPGTGSTLTWVVVIDILLDETMLCHYCSSISGSVSLFCTRNHVVIHHYSHRKQNSTPWDAGLCVGVSRGSV